jgi:hypothetical protein
MALNTDHSVLNYRFDQKNNNWTLSTNEPDKKPKVVRKRRPRTNTHQLAIFQAAFIIEPNPSIFFRNLLSPIIGLSEFSIKIWFQNQRQNFKKQENFDQSMDIFKKREMVLDILHFKFRSNPQPSNHEIEEISKIVNISAKLIKIWFLSKFMQSRPSSNNANILG